MTSAGGSAKAEYERRRQKDRDARRRNIWRSLAFVLLTPIVVYAAVQLGAWAINRWLLSSMYDEIGVKGRQEVINASTVRTFGLLFAAIATLRMGISFWGARPTTESWRKGSEGEEKTGRALDRLTPDYIVLHDLRMPASRANIDHVVVGPTGVFVVETKNYSSEVVIRRGVARRAGRSMASVVEQANRQAAALRTALGCGVRAIVCVQGAPVKVDGFFAKPLVDGVRFCSGSQLLRVITRRDTELDQKEVTRLAATATGKLGRPEPAPVGQPRSVCDCGGEMVLRHRRADGSPFFGCSRYPSCRRVAPV